MSGSTTGEGGAAASDIYRQLRGLIVSGVLAGGERLPTVRQVAGDVGVAPGTAAKAFRQLEQEGLVVTRAGAGTRVSADAALLPRGVVDRLRSLIAESRAQNVSMNDVLAALQASWGSDDRTS